MKSLSRFWFFTIPQTAAYQAAASMGFSRQEYWSGVPLPSPRATVLASIYWWPTMYQALFPPKAVSLNCHNNSRYHYHAILQVWKQRPSTHMETGRDVLVIQACVLTCILYWISSCWIAVPITRQLFWLTSASRRMYISTLALSKGFTCTLLHPLHKYWMTAP